MFVSTFIILSGLWSPDSLLSLLTTIFTRLGLIPDLRLEN